MNGLGTVSNGEEASGINVFEPPDYSESSVLITLTTLIAYKIQNTRIRERSGNIAIKF